MADSNQPASVPASTPVSSAVPSTTGEVAARAPGAALPGVDANAVQLYAGPVSLWMAWKTFFVGTLVDLAGIALLIIWSLKRPEHAAWSTPAMIAGFALLFASSLMMLYAAMSVHACRYTITMRCIEREMGLFVKTVDALPMGHVKHVDLKQSFFGRIINVGTIEVFCGPDDSKPHWLLEGIPNPRPTYEKLRDAVMDLTNRRGIILE